MNCHNLLDFYQLVILSFHKSCSLILHRQLNMSKIVAILVVFFLSWLINLHEKQNCPVPFSVYPESACRFDRRRRSVTICDLICAVPVERCIYSGRQSLGHLRHQNKVVSFHDFNKNWERNCTFLDHDGGIFPFRLLFRTHYLLNLILFPENGLQYASFRSFLAIKSYYTTELRYKYTSR